MTIQLYSHVVYNDLMTVTKWLHWMHESVELSRRVNVYECHECSSGCDDCDEYILYLNCQRQRRNEHI